MICIFTYSIVVVNVVWCNLINCTFVLPPYSHEDGSVRFWDASSTSLHLLYKLNTANIFGLDISADQTHNEDEDWPPFRKVLQYKQEVES